MARGRGNKHVRYRRLISPDANSLLFAKVVENVIDPAVADAALIGVSAACSQGRGILRVKTAPVVHVLAPVSRGAAGEFPGPERSRPRTWKQIQERWKSIQPAPAYSCLCCRMGFLGLDQHLLKTGDQPLPKVRREWRLGLAGIRKMDIDTVRQVRQKVMLWKEIESPALEWTIRVILRAFVPGSKDWCNQRLEQLPAFSFKLIRIGNVNDPLT